MPTSAVSLAQNHDASVVAALGADPEVRFDASGRGFGASTLRTHGRMFAMLASRERFVVKLPQARVAELLQTGVGTPFGMGHGRVMREWVVIAPMEPSGWIALAREALLHVAAARPRPPARGRGRSP